MKKRVITVIITVLFVFCLFGNASALSVSEEELLSLFGEFTEKIKCLAYAKYPDGIIENPAEYKMRITYPTVLDNATKDGFMVASKINAERFLLFYSEVFTEEISSFFLDNHVAPLSVCGAFAYESDYYMIPGYVWNLPSILIGPDLEHCTDWNTEKIHYDELTITGNEAVMRFTLWNFSGSVPYDPVSDTKIGEYDLHFLKTSEGWKVSGGSFLEFFVGQVGDQISPETGSDQGARLTVISLISAVFIIALIIRQKRERIQKNERPEFGSR